MSFFKTLSAFQEYLCQKAANDEKPEAILKKDSISELFLSFVDDYGDEGERSEYFKKWYEEIKENAENPYENLNDFVYRHVLFYHNTHDVGTEYLRLKEEAEECIHLAQAKKAAIDVQLKNIGNKNDAAKKKLIYEKQRLAGIIKKVEDESGKKKLVGKAINDSSFPDYMGFFDRGFWADILAIQDIGSDKRDMIFFGELPVTSAEKMRRLKKSDKKAYLDVFEEMVSSLRIAEKIEEIAEENCYLQDRKNILSTGLKLLNLKNYEAFVYLEGPQIEGLFRLYLRMIGDNSHAGGMQEIAEKIDEKEHFYEFVYFAFDFSALRNKIAHGEIVEIGREQAYEILMDIYWIIKEIDSDERDYKIWIQFIQKCAEYTDISQIAGVTLEFFTGLEKEKYIKLLERYLKGEFSSEIIWYGLDNEAKSWQLMIQSNDFYEMIWNGEALQVKEGSIDIGKETFSVVRNNDECLKYQAFVELLRKYKYVPEKWYKQYNAFCENISALQENDTGMP